MICFSCKQPISPTSSAIKYKNKNYHQECFDKIKEEAAKANEKKQGRKASLDSPVNKTLESFLVNHMHIEGKTNLILLKEQLNKLHNTYNASWESILLTARYCFEMKPYLGEKITSVAGLAWYIDEAESFWKKMDEVKENNKKFIEEHGGIPNKVNYIPYRSKPDKKIRFTSTGANMEDL